MKSLQEYITEDKKIIFENTAQFFEEYVRDNSNFTEHFKKRIKQGKLPMDLYLLQKRKWKMS